MFSSGLLAVRAHTHGLKKDISLQKKEAVFPTLFIHFNPNTEFGQKSLNPAPFNDLSAYSFLGGCGVRTLCMKQPLTF